MEVVGLDCGAGENFKGELFGIKICLPLPLSLVEASLVGIDGCVDVSLVATAQIGRAHV